MFMPKNDALEQRIKEETANIQVDSYQKVASLGGWSGGGRTLWAISAVAAVSSALIGAVAPFFPAIALAVAGDVTLGAAMATAVGAMTTSIAAFAATGLAFGFAGGMMLGRISGSNAAVAQEQERRQKAREIEQTLTQNPQATIEHEAPKEPAPKLTFKQKLKKAYYEYFNPRVGAVMTLIGITGGLVLASAFVLTDGAIGTVMPNILDKLTGLAPEIAKSPLAVTAFTAGVCGSIGALWHLNYPKITSEVTHFFGELISGKTLGREWEVPQPVKLKNTSGTALDRIEPQTAQPEPALAQAAEGINGLAVRQFTSYTELVAQRAAEQQSDQLIKR